MKLELEATRVTIQLNFTGKRGPFTCSEASCAKTYHAPEHTWRHLDTMQFETVLVAWVPQADYQSYGIKIPEVPRA